jgi:endonuclease/exonuclease/phosphatase family metal-dependent hydrolase
MGGAARLRLHAHRSKAARWASDHLPVVAEIALPKVN